ncbi:TRAPP subunit trs31 [Pseudocyphellaria aurata]|nr:TRAPP subunit trs31 [Pseudocyphellaria aurata]
MTTTHGPIPTQTSTSLPSRPSQILPSSSTASTLPHPSSTSHGGLRTPSNRKTIYDRNLNRTRTAELSRASFAYLFGEMVIYAQRRVTGIQDLEKRLNAQGYPLGLRLLPLLLHRDPPRPPPARPTRILPLLQFLHGPLWRHLFGRAADAIEHSSTARTEYMLSDNEPMVNGYVSVPREMSQLNCAAYVAGVVEGVCDACGLCANVSAHNAATELWPCKTVFLIRFEEDVVEREGAEGRR